MCVGAGLLPVSLQARFSGSFGASFAFSIEHGNITAILNSIVHGLLALLCGILFNQLLGRMMHRGNPSTRIIFVLVAIIVGMYLLSVALIAVVKSALSLDNLPWVEVFYGPAIYIASCCFIFAILYWFQARRRNAT